MRSVPRGWREAASGLDRGDRIRTVARTVSPVCWPRIQGSSGPGPALTHLTRPIPRDASVLLDSPVSVAGRQDVAHRSAFEPVFTARAEPRDEWYSPGTTSFAASSCWSARRSLARA